MLTTRYEEYISFKDNIPFILSVDLERTPTVCTPQSNWHENLEIQLCTDGEGYVILDGNKINITKGDIVVANSGVIHYTSSFTKIKYTCIILDSKFCKQADIDPHSLNFEQHFRSEALTVLFDKIKTICINENDICRTAKLRELLLQMLIVLRENHTVTEKQQTIKSSKYKTIKNSVLFIRENFNRQMTLEEIAKTVFIDKYSLSREFKKITGQTVIEYINAFRCNKAIEFIKEGYCIADAARMCGFNNMSFFTKTFKKQFGKLPKEYKSK